MYIDFGKRGRINFTWKELSIVISLFIGGVTTLASTKANLEISGLKDELVLVQGSLKDCKARLDRQEGITNKIEMPGPPQAPKHICGPPCIAPDWTRKVVKP